MTLLVDIGNTRTKYILTRAIYTDKSKVVDNPDINFDWLNGHFKDVKRICISCVTGNTLLKTISDWADDKDIDLKIIESEEKRYGLVSSYQQPKKLGVDRWLVMIGALNLYPDKDILIVDAGTATTIDLLSSTGKHQGGWIIPGINLMIDSLLANTSKIEVKSELNPSISFGQNTNTNVNNGSWAAIIGAINLAVSQASKHPNSFDLILLTGGNARYIETLLEHKVIIEENLIFHGLQRYNLD
tara:strand:+ start:271 stop:999 length:729 start_codon:yes stop_codon:yes gene_type:complete